MAKSENQKLKTLYVAKFFLENSDEDHPVSASEIVDYLREECSVEAERRSIYRDIAVLRDEFGMDIDGGQGGRYRLLSRQFEFDDLRILAECVHAAKFISAAKAKDLVETIGEFCSIYQADLLQQEVYLTDRVKTTQKGTLNIISTIYAAMPSVKNRNFSRSKKISFKYLKHTIDDVNAQVERRSGATYKVTPFRLVINDGYYYLIAFDDRTQEMRTYRVDRMKSVNILDEQGESPWRFRGIDLDNYTQRAFSMFGGEKRNVTIRLTNNLLDAVIDRFGTKSAMYRKEGEDHFAVSAEVEISDQFYAWVCQFGDKAKILSPKDAVKGMKEFLNKISKQY